MKPNKILKIGMLVLGAICLAIIRYFETKIFYDPLIDFYDGKFHTKPFPDLEFWIYNFNLIFRYVLNTGISIVIIWFLFKKKSYIKFSILSYAIFFVIGFLMFWIVAYDIESKDFMLLFYIRRFLIQPILLIILIPAFYFQKLNKKVPK